MTSPQLENGYIRIVNELYQAMYRVNLSASELRVLHFIVYQTFGFNHTSRRLTSSYISEGTGIPNSTARKAIDGLIDKNIVIAKSNGTHTIRTLQINKNYKKWCTDFGTPKTDYRCTDFGTLGAPKMDNNTRQNKTRQKKQDRECGGTPAISEVVSYFSAHRFSEECAKDFFEYYDALDWRVKGTKIVKWEVFADRWMKTEKRIQPAEPELDVFGNPIKREERE